LWMTKERYRLQIQWKMATHSSEEQFGSGEDELPTGKD